MRVTRQVQFTIVAVAALLAGPSGAGRAVAASHDDRANVGPSSFVETVRDATRGFQDPQSAIDQQYLPFLGCVSGPQEGAMGVHYVNMGLVGDGELDPNKPEALIYEFRNGQARLLGVEYIVFAADWHKNHQEAPTLEGQTLQFNGAPNRFAIDAFYELHVWAWRENPNGVFVDWHPHVSCEGE